ncbi:primosomal protein N' (replication factor Y) - superfamily II helicase [Palleronia sp. KMU-117]|uniref:primosomal protein N' (replication factor Y) - superfamily II helicase n=1 Tax=Palleronia sp. KMU-117 TaxID=3434108 RepID=UPI003D711500
MTEPERATTEAVEEHRYPCQTCGSAMRFDPAGVQLVCDHCGNTEPILGGGSARRALRELDFKAALANLLPQTEIEETRVLSCPNCGAQVEFDNAVHAAECPFCATPVVTDTGVHRHIKPKGLLPFALTEDEARAAVGKWLGNLWFAPGGLQQYARRGRRMNGLYLPYWTFDADTRSRYRGQRGTVYHESRQVVINGKRTTQSVRKVRWTPASGQVARFFDDVLVVASRSLPAPFRNALGAWDLSSLEPYRPEFLAGFRAEGYSVQLDDAFVEAREVMDRVIERDVKFDIGGDVQQVQAVETQIGDVTFKHILLPVWMAAYKYRGKTYRIAVNGRSGQVAGERPYSAWKIAFALIVGAIVAAAIGYFMALQEGGFDPSGF